MTRLKLILSVILIYPFITWGQSSEVRIVNLYNEEVSIQIPKSWKVKEGYRKYADYQIKYDVKASDVSTKTTMTVDVHDSTFRYRKPITVEMLNDFKAIEIDTKGKSVEFIQTEIITLNNHQLGLSKYTFQNSKGRKSYGTQIFFRTSYENFYVMDIYSMGIQPEEFKKTVEKIIKSIHFKE